MILPAFTEVTFLVMLAHEMPGEYAKDPERFAVIAMAAKAAQDELLPSWHRDPRLLGAAIATGIRKESGGWESVHDGSLNGKAGEICLMQIHPTNTRWKHWAPSFEALAGVDLQATTWCLLTGGKSLISAASYCMARNYRRNWAPAMWTMYHYGDRCWLSPEAKARTALMNRLAYTDWKPTDEQLEVLAWAKKNQRQVSDD
jgi:hypothetical protein